MSISSKSKKSKDNSVFADNVKSNIMIIQEAISDAGLFNDNYENVLNTVDTINEQVKSYNTLSKTSIMRDLYDLAMSDIDFLSHRDILVKQLKSPEMPEYHDIKPITEPIYKLERIDGDSISDMWASLINDDKKSIKRYIKIKNNVMASLNDYIDEISLFERRMVEYRTRSMEILKHNVDELFNIHAAYAWTVKNKLSVDRFKKMDVILCVSQREFIEKNLKNILKIT